MVDIQYDNVIMGGREVSRPYRVWFFAEGECFLCFLFLCPQYLSLLELVKRRILFAQLLAVRVDVTQAGVYDVALCRELTVERRVLGCVERHKKVGHDATAAIDHAVASQGVTL